MAMYGTYYNNNSSTQSSNDTINNLYPALIECFGVILLGYIIGRLGFISSTESKGLSKFVMNATLPAFIFRAIVTLDFSRVAWKFVLVVTLAKFLLFAGVVILTLLFTRNIGKAGIYGAFCTVSNDLALGIPVLRSLYKDTHEHFIDCIYLLVVVSLVIILPVGMLMMEFSNQRSKKSSIKLSSTLLKTVIAVLKHPVVIGSILGIPCNFIFNQKIPNALDKFFVTLSNGFPATVLFFLGLSVVGQIKAQVNTGILVPLSLVAAKVIILPLMIRALLTSFNVGGSKMNEAWSVFGFIYGAIPTAPPVAVYASVYGIDEKMLTSGMVMATFFSAPVIYTSSKMASVHEMNSTLLEYRNLLTNTRNDISFVAIVAACWVIFVLLITRRFKVPPHNYTIYLAVTQLCLCVSFVLTKSETFIKHYVKLGCFLITTFLFATHCWCAVLAFALARIRCHTSQNTLPKKLANYFFGWGLPVCCSGLLLIFLDSKLGSFSNEKQDLFHYLQEQTIFSAFWVTIQFACVFICISSLIYLHRCDSYCKCKMVKERRKIDENTPLLLHKDSKKCHRCNNEESCRAAESGPSRLETVCVTDIEDIDVVVRQKANEKGNKYRKTDDMKDKLKLEKYYEGEHQQSGRHVIVIVCLNLLMIVCIFYCMWILVGDDLKSGIALEVQLLVSIILSGQVFIVFALFGFERTLLIYPLLQKLRRCWSNVDKVILPSIDDLPPDEYHICEQFVRHHKTNCLQSLTCNERPSIDTYASINGDTYASINGDSNSFSGSELVDWLVEVGLVADRITAVYYGNSLLIGHVIQHIENRHYFTDTPLVYEFCEGWEHVADEHL